MCEEGGKDGNEFQEPEKRRRLTILVQPNVCVCVYVCVCVAGDGGKDRQVLKETNEGEVDFSLGERTTWLRGHGARWRH